MYTLRSKLRLFNTLVKPVLLCGSETSKIIEAGRYALQPYMSLGPKRIGEVRWA